MSDITLKMLYEVQRLGGTILVRGSNIKAGVLVSDYGVHALDNDKLYEMTISMFPQKGPGDLEARITKGRHQGVYGIRLAVEDVVSCNAPQGED